MFRGISWISPFEGQSKIADKFSCEPFPPWQSSKNDIPSLDSVHILDAIVATLRCLVSSAHMGLSINGGIPNSWLVDAGKSGGKSHRSKWMMTGGSPMTKRKPPYHPIFTVANQLDPPHPATVPGRSERPAGRCCAESLATKKPRLSHDESTRYIYAHIALLSYIVMGMEYIHTYVCIYIYRCIYR